MRRPIAAVAALASIALVGGSLSATATAAASSAPAPTSAKPVNLAPLPAQSEVGKRITVKGKVTGGRATVRIQRKYAGSGWQNVARTTSTKAGSYAVKVKLVRGGTTSFRAVKGAAKSGARSLKVYQWLDLTQQPHYAFGEAGATNQSIRMGGRRFATAFQSVDGTTFRQFDLGGQCRRVELWTGFPDASVPDLEPDDRQVLQWGSYTAGFPALPPIGTPPGPAVRRVLNTTGHQTLVTFAQVNQQNASSAPPLAVLGSPRASCNAPRLGEVAVSDIDLKVKARSLSGR